MQINGVHARTDYSTVQYDQLADKLNRIRNNAETALLGDFSVKVWKRINDIMDSMERI